MKIGLLTSSEMSDFNLKTLKNIVTDSNFLIKVAIIDKRPKLSLKQKLIKNLKRGRGGYILVMAFQRFFSKKSYSISTVEYCSNNHIEIIETKKPYSNTTIEKIKEYDLDVLILTGGFGIVKKKILNITTLGVLSYHHGDMRKYRGMPPAIWELYNNEEEMGVTVQILSEGLDSGIPIEEKKIKISKKDTLKKLQKRASDESIDMLYKAVLKLSKKDYKPIKIDKFGKVYSLPNFRQWIILKMKLLFRRLK
ncbi:MAG: formyltransferase family protein [Flavobacteriaceae bacterium]|nr:formyltransferase family protein [Flavobacteriaceae bacterium]